MRCPARCPPTEPTRDPGILKVTGQLWHREPEAFGEILGHPGEYGPALRREALRRLDREEARGLIPVELVP
jgi:hypothetical protein